MELKVVKHKKYGDVYLIPKKLKDIAEEQAVKNGVELLKSPSGHWIVRLNEEGGAGEIGTPKLTKNYMRVTPGQWPIETEGKDKYKKSLKKIVKEWTDNPATKAMYLERYKLEDLAIKNIQETKDKLEDYIDKEDLILKRKNNNVDHY